MLTINIDNALQMFAAGWTVQYSPASDDIEWRSPGGIPGSDYHSESLNSPPPAAIEMAEERGDINKYLRFRTPA